MGIRPRSESGLRSRRMMNIRSRVRGLTSGDRYFNAFGPWPPTKRRLPGRFGRGMAGKRFGFVGHGPGFSLEWQCGLQASDNATVAADSIRLESVGHLAPPLWVHRKVALRGSDVTTQNPDPPRKAKGCVTKTTDFSRFAVYGAAMLAGLYHRSVLRCGCLAERNPGVEGILPAVRAAEKKRFAMSRIGYPRQRGAGDPNL